MTVEELGKLFDDHEGEYLKFDRIQQAVFPGTLRPDLYAFNLLDAIVKDKTDIVSGASHDVIWLDVSLEKLAANAFEWQIIDLIRCGVMYDEETESLSMFV